jgi:hypothetical protein
MGELCGRTLWEKGRTPLTPPTFVLDAVPKQPESKTKFVCIDSYGDDMGLNIWTSNACKRALAVPP